MFLLTCCMPIKFTAPPSIFVCYYLKCYIIKQKKKKKKKKIYICIYISPPLRSNKMFFPCSRSIRSLAQGFQYRYKVIINSSCSFHSLSVPPFDLTDFPFV